MPAQVKVNAATANTHDRNAQDVLVRLATYNPMGGVARLSKLSEGEAVRRRVSFDQVQALTHFKKGPSSTARQSALLHSSPSHPMRTRFGRVHSVLHSQHFSLKEPPWSDRSQTSHLPPPVPTRDCLYYSGQYYQSLYLEAMKRSSAKIDIIENFSQGRKCAKMTIPPHPRPLFRRSSFFGRF